MSGDIISLKVAASVGISSQQALHARGQCSSYRTGVELHLSFADAQHAMLGKEAHNLFGEQRVALGLFRHQPRKSLRQNLSPEPRLDQTPDIARW